MKDLVGKRINSKVKFMGTDLIINKLSVSEVMEIQDLVKEMGDDEDSGFNLLKHVVQLAVPDAADLTDDDFKSFPMEELSKLSNSIMKHSGMLNEGK